MEPIYLSLASYRFPLRFLTLKLKCGSHLFVGNGILKSSNNNTFLTLVAMSGIPTRRDKQALYYQQNARICEGHVIYSVSNDANKFTN